MASNLEPTPDPPRQEGVSLDELVQAFAQVMGAAPKSTTTEPPCPAPPTEAPAEPTAATVEPLPEPLEPAADDDSCPVNPRTILEAMLFVGDRDNQTLSSARAAELMRGVDRSEIGSLVHELNQRYAANGSPYYIAAEGDAYRMAIRRPFHAVRDRFYGRIREARLSRAAIDVLAIVAYQQPLTAEQISTLRGKPSSHVLSQLVHRGLLRIERLPGKRRTVQYFTTDRFLKLFGLQTLADLPQSEELERQ